MQIDILITNHNLLCHVYRIYCVQLTQLLFGTVVTGGWGSWAKREGTKEGRAEQHDLPRPSPHWQLVRNFAMHPASHQEGAAWSRKGLLQISMEGSPGVDLRVPRSRLSPFCSLFTRFSYVRLPALTPPPSSREAIWSRPGIAKPDRT